MGVKKLPKVKELQTEYAKLLEEKKKTYAEYRRSREEMRELLTAKANVDRVLKMEVEQDVEKEKDQDVYKRQGLLSTVIALLGVAVLITYSPQNGAILLVIAFLISPMGLPLAAILLLGKVQDLKFAIQDWMYG